MHIRAAQPSDAEELLAIYAPYVTETAVTFEEEIPSKEEFAARIEKTLSFFPYLVAEEDGEILGYSYASHFHPRSAYRCSAEVTAYVRQGYGGRGIGRAMYTALEACLRRQNITNLNACIAFPNVPSERFHAAMGYKTVAHFTKCGYKLGQWQDMIWMEKFLCAHENPPKPVVPWDGTL